MLFPCPTPKVRLVCLFACLSVCLSVCICLSVSYIQWNIFVRMYEWVLKKFSTYVRNDARDTWLHVAVFETLDHWFRKWLVAWPAPSHYLNQCWIIVNWTLRNRLQWNLNRNSNIYIQENAFESVVCETAAILSRPFVSCVMVHFVHFEVYVTKRQLVCKFDIVESNFLLMFCFYTLPKFYQSFSSPMNFSEIAFLIVITVSSFIARSYISKTFNFFLFMNFLRIDTVWYHS